MNKTGNYREAEILRKVDVTEINPFRENWGKSTLVLKDYTASGYNNLDPHPTYLKYYANEPYQVQITDEDDFILQKNFSSLPEAQHFFEDFLNNPEKMIGEMD